MSNPLDARRKAAAAAAPAAAAAAPKAKAAAPAKKAAVADSVRSVANGRAYMEHEAAMDENGKPAYRSIFDAAGHNAKAITKETKKDRVVPTSTFVEHINHEVFKRIFGVPLRGKVAKMILLGIADQFLVLTEKGYKTKLPNVASFTKTERKARKARNPRTGAEVPVPAHSTMSAKAARAAKQYIRKAGA